MYRDFAHEPRWMRILRWLSRSFRLGRLFGVEVRVYWLTLVVLPLFGLLEFAEWGLPVAEVVTLAVLLTFWLYLVVLSHEFSHVLAARRYGVFTPLITLSPIGGLAHLSAPVPNPRADIVVSLAGPAVHLLWLAVVWPLAHVVDPDLLRPAGWTFSPLYFSLTLLEDVNLWLMLFNLLPFFPLDGGRVLRAVLCLRLQPGRATILAARIGMFGAVGFAIWGLVRGELWGTILIVIGISNFLACRQEIRMARYHMGPYAGAEPREPWQGDPDAWRAGRPAGPWARWRTGRRRRRETQATEDAARLELELDRVLDRVNEVGLAGLTRAERKTLEQASKRKRD